MKKYLIPLVALAVAGCSARAVLVEKKVAYDPQTEARVRIYQANGNATTKAYPNLTCQDLNDNDSTKAKPSRNPFAKENTYNGLPRRTLKSISIGMPLTQRAVQDLARTKVTEAESFIEQVIPANQPILIQGSTFVPPSGIKIGVIPVYKKDKSCRVRKTFTPKAGMDYEVDYRYENDQCLMDVYELEVVSTSAESKVAAKAGKNVPLTQCVETN